MLTNEEVEQAVVLDVVHQLAVARRFLDQHRDEVLVHHHPVVRHRQHLLRMRLQPPLRPRHRVAKVVAQLPRKRLLGPRVEHDALASERARRQDVLQLVVDEHRTERVDARLAQHVLVEPEVGLALAGLSRREDAVKERPLGRVPAVAQIRQVRDGDVGHGEDPDAVLGLELADEGDDGLVGLQRRARLLKRSRDLRRRHVELGRGIVVRFLLGDVALLVLEPGDRAEDLLEHLRRDGGGGDGGPGEEDVAEVEDEVVAVGRARFVDVEVDVGGGRGEGNSEGL